MCTWLHRHALSGNQVGAWPAPDEIRRFAVSEGDAENWLAIFSEEDLTLLQTCIQKPQVAGDDIARLIATRILARPARTLQDVQRRARFHLAGHELLRDQELWDAGESKNILAFEIAVDSSESDRHFFVGTFAHLDENLHRCPALFETHVRTIQTFMSWAARVPMLHLQRAFAVSTSVGASSKDEGLLLHVSTGPSGRDMVGASPAFKQLTETIRLVAPTNATVLIRGERGSGKELVARALHFCSQRQDGPFVCLNCAALTDTLLESELFGHEKGAFTSAVSERPGRFEMADGGTIFLDEIGEMSISTQAKLLRILDGHPFERVGGSTSILVDVRVVVATNQPLEQNMEKGAFRRDLFDRLNVVEIRVPPLRDRLTDVPLLVEYYLKRFAHEIGRTISGITPAALQKLQAHDWLGNVRQLENLIKCIVALWTGGQTIDVEHISLPVSVGPGPGRNEPQIKVDQGTTKKDRSRQKARKDLEDMDTAYKETGRIGKASEQLGFNRASLSRRAKEILKQFPELRHEFSSLYDAIEKAQRKKIPERQ